MARVETMLLLLLHMSILLVMVKSSLSLQPDYTRYSMQFYETIPGSDTIAFYPLLLVPHKGVGYIKHNNVLHTSKGYQVGIVGGLYFYHNTDAIEDVVTITFSKTGTSGIWSGSSISLRGHWVMTPDGNADTDSQELAIVGGQGGFKGATGTVYYRKVATQPNTVFLVTCDIYVPNSWNQVPKIYIDLENELKSVGDAVKVQPEFWNFTE